MSLAKIMATLAKIAVYHRAAIHHGGGSSGICNAIYFSSGSLLPDVGVKTQIFQVFVDATVDFIIVSSSFVGVGRALIQSADGST